MKVVIVNYGMGNLASVQRSLEECGASVVLASEPQVLSDATHIVLPGVGAFTDGMRRLTEMGWVDPVRKAASVDRIPLLGICLGMQLLATWGEEGGGTAGLDLVPGEVIRFKPDNPRTKVPHVGWNEVHFEKPSSLFAGIESGSDFYFVHSYRFVPSGADTTLASTPYCGKFVSVVQKDNLVGVQFHPEKSSQVGRRLLRNFLAA
jgi:glutamine amidotransferase